MLLIVSGLSLNVWREDHVFKGYLHDITVFRTLAGELRSHFVSILYLPSCCANPKLEKLKGLTFEGFG